MNTTPTTYAKGKYTYDLLKSSHGCKGKRGSLIEKDQHVLEHTLNHLNGNTKSKKVDPLGVLTIE
jgi:hypothetical protein